MNKTATPPLEEKLPAEMTYEELLDLREQANHQIEELTAAIQVVNEELVLRLSADKLTGKVVGNWGISKAVRYSFKTTLDEARSLGAIKEAVDSAKLKTLLGKGIPVPGVTRSEYIMVREVEKEKVVNGSEK